MSCEVAVDAEEKSAAMPLLEHLEHLRMALLASIFAVLIFFPFFFYFSDNILDLLTTVVDKKNFTFQFFSPMEPFFVKMKLSFLGAVVFTSPFCAYKIWGFVSPGLYNKEKSFVLKLSFFSWLLFVFGILFAFFFILPFVMRFSLGMQTESLTACIGIDKYVSLALWMIIGFGMMFQFPIIIYGLVKYEIVSLETVSKQRPVVLVLIMFLSALLTPPDIFTQLLMGIPTYLLFEITLLICKNRRPV